MLIVIAFGVIGMQISQIWQIYCLWCILNTNTLPYRKAVIVFRNIGTRMMRILADCLFIASFLYNYPTRYVAYVCVWEYWNPDFNRLALLAWTVLRSYLIAPMYIKMQTTFR